MGSSPLTRTQGARRLDRRAFIQGTAAAAFASGCAQSPDRDGPIRFWAMGREAAVVNALLPDFKARHPELTVRVQQLPWTAAHQKLLTAFAGDATPDVCQLGNTWIPELAALDALEPLDPLQAHSEVVDREDYFRGIWDTNVVDGVLLGIHWYVDTRLLFYRKDLLAQAGFSRPPRDWPEWSRMLGAIKRMVGPDRYSVLLPLNEFEPLLVFALQQEEPLLRDGGRFGNFRSAGFRRALGFYAEIFRRGWAPTVTNTQISNVWNELGRGFYSFYLSGPWNIGEFKRRLSPDLQPTWGTASMPGPTGPGASSAGGSSLVIFRRSTQKAGAWKLVEFLSRPEILLRFHELTGNLPPRRSVWEVPRLASDPYARAFREQLERVVPVPQVPEWERIMEEMRYMAERVVRGRATVEQGAEQLDAVVDAILEKRRWLLDRAGGT